MDIGEVLSRSWQIIWKHKVLWIFGILASLTGEFRMSYSGGTPPTEMSGNAYPTVPPEFFRTIDQTPSWVIFLILGGLILLSLIIAIIFYILSTIGHIGVVHGTQLADEGAEKLPFGELFKGSFHYFWRIFLLDILIGLAIFVLVGGFIFVSIISAVITFGLALACILPLMCLMVPVGIIISIWLQQARIAIIVEDISMWDGLQRGWEVLKENASSYALMWLVLGLAISLVAGFILAMPMMLLMVPLFSGLFVEELRFMLWLALAGILLYLPFLLVLGGILYTYVTAGWTVTYLRLTHHTPLLDVGGEADDDDLPEDDATLPAPEDDEPDEG